MSILLWRGPAVLVGLIGVTFSPRMLVLSPNASRGKLKAVDVVKHQLGFACPRPQGGWGRGWSNNRDIASQRALAECYRRGQGCSNPTCTSGRG